MYRIIPNLVGPLIYLDNDNFLLDYILSQDNYLSNDEFYGIIEGHLTAFADNLLKVGYTNRYPKDSQLSQEQIQNKYNLYYNFSDEKFNTKIFYYREFVRDGIDTSESLSMAYRHKGFFQHDITQLSKLQDKTLIIFNDCFDVSVKPTFEWSLDVSYEKKDGYKKISQGVKQW